MIVGHHSGCCWRTVSNCVYACSWIPLAYLTSRFNDYWWIIAFKIFFFITDEVCIIQRITLEHGPCIQYTVFPVKNALSFRSSQRKTKKKTTVIILYKQIMLILIIKILFLSPKKKDSAILKPSFALLP